MTSTSTTRTLLNDGQFLRCLSFSKEVEATLRGEAARGDYCFINVSLANIHGSEDVMKRMAGALRFPAHFGVNWDAFLDMVTDLSWNPAPGYVLLIKEAEELLQLPSEQLCIFIRLCLAAVERWQSGEDEEGRTVPKTPFYFFLDGGASFCRLVADLSANA